MKHLIKFLMSVGIYTVCVYILWLIKCMTNIELSKIIEQVGIVSLVGWSMLLSNIIMKHPKKENNGNQD